MYTVVLEGREREGMNGREIGSTKKRGVEEGGGGEKEKEGEGRECNRVI